MTQTELLVSRVMVRPWDDPVRMPVSLPLQGPYMEFCWLGVIGPTAAWALRRLALPLLACPEAHEVDLSVLATELGLGHSAAKAQAALDRLARFGLARWAGIGELEVVTAVPLLPGRHLGHLSAWARRYHDQALAGVAGIRRVG